MTIFLGCNEVPQDEHSPYSGPSGSKDLPGGSTEDLDSPMSFTAALNELVNSQQDEIESLRLAAQERHGKAARYKHERDALRIQVHIFETRERGRATEAQNRENEIQRLNTALQEAQKSKLPKLVAAEKEREESQQALSAMEETHANLKALAMKWEKKVL